MAAALPTDIQAQRHILPDLVERVVPQPIGSGKYKADITWTPLGRALQQLREAVAAA